MIRVAINGYGRIGRAILRAFYANPLLRKTFKIVAINDPADLKIHTHLTQFDSVHGKFDKPVFMKGNQLTVDGDAIDFYHHSDITLLPWKSLNVHFVLECSGRFCSGDKASAHIKAGANKVLISAPADGVDATVVFGVNEDSLTDAMRIVSNASCTTNCLAPMAKVLHEHIGIECGTMTTVHAYTNDQCLTDSPHSDLYRSRAAATNMIPTKTGAAKAVGLVLPELSGKLSAMAIRIPTANVSLIDFNFIARKNTSTAAINKLMQIASLKNPKVLAFNELPLVSSDFNHHPASSIFDGGQTVAQGKLVKVIAWYDNEWGFANRMLDVIQFWSQKK